MLSYFEYLKTHGARFLDGTIITLEQTALAIIIAVSIAIIAAFMKMSTISPIRWVGIAYIELFRGTSLLVQMYWIFFVLPLFDITLSKFMAGFIAIGPQVQANRNETGRESIQSESKKRQNKKNPIHLHQQRSTPE